MVVLADCSYSPIHYTVKSPSNKKRLYVQTVDAQALDLGLSVIALDGIGDGDLETLGLGACSAGKASAVQKANESMEMLRGMAEGK